LYRGSTGLSEGVFTNPDDAESGFLLCVLNADQIPRSQRMFEPLQERTPQADVSSTSVVVEGPAITIDAPNTHRDRRVSARALAAFDHGSPPDYPRYEAAISVMSMGTCLTKVTTKRVEDRGDKTRVWGEKRIGVGSRADKLAHREGCYALSHCRRAIPYGPNT